MTTNRLMEEALRLPPQKRVELVDHLLDSLDRPDPEIDALWLREAESRLEAYRRGEMKAVSLDEVLAKYRGVPSHAIIPTVTKRFDRKIWSHDGRIPPSRPPRGSDSLARAGKGGG